MILECNCRFVMLCRQCATDDWKCWCHLLLSVSEKWQLTGKPPASAEKLVIDFKLSMKRVFFYQRVSSLTPQDHGDISAVFRMHNLALRKGIRYHNDNKIRNQQDYQSILILQNEIRIATLSAVSKIHWSPDKVQVAGLKYFLFCARQPIIQLIKFAWLYSPYL